MRPLALLLLFGLGTARAEAPTNPHGSDACATCHVDAAPTAPPATVVATCRECHADADHHPDSMVPSAFPVAEGWPMEGGKVTCATCHVEPSHEGQAGIPTPYLRGGPYAAGADFCYACHGRTAVTRSDPHHPTTPYGADDPSCGACHSGVPARGVSPEEAQLRLGAGAVCTTCHPGTPHWGTHVDHAVPEDVRATLPPEMPLLTGSVVSCWTCHDVHAGVAAGAAGDSPLAKGLHDAAVAGPWSDIPSDAIFPGSDPEHPPMLARPLEKSALCAACHGDGP